jgi:hypothetical protein
VLDKNRKVEEVLQMNSNSSSVPISYECNHLYTALPLADNFSLIVVFRKKCHEMFSGYLLLRLLSVYLLITYIAYH